VSVNKRTFVKSCDTNTNAIFGGGQSISVCSQKCTFTNGFIFSIKVTQVISNFVEINVNI